MYLNVETEGETDRQTDRQKVCKKTKKTNDNVLKFRHRGRQTERKWCKLDFYKMRLFVSVFVRACFLHLTLSDLT